MSSPEDRDKKRRRLKNRVVKDLKKFKKKPPEEKKKVLLKDLTHSELIRLINEDFEAPDKKGGDS